MSVANLTKHLQHKIVLLSKRYEKKPKAPKRVLGCTLCPPLPPRRWGGITGTFLGLKAAFPLLSPPLDMRAAHGPRRNRNTAILPKTISSRKSKCTRTMKRHVKKPHCYCAALIQIHWSLPFSCLCCLIN